MTPRRISVKTLFFLNGFMQANLVARFPRLMEMYSIDNKTLGLALFLVALGAVLAMPFTGWLAARTRGRAITVMTMTLYYVLFAFVPLMPDTPEVVGIFFFLGAASGTVNVVINALAIDVERELAKPIMASFHALFSIGMFAGAACGSMFVKFGFDILAHLSILSVLSIAGSFIAFLYLPRTSPELTTGHAFRLPDASILAIGAIIFCSALGESTMSEWSTNYMANVAGASQIIAPWGLSGFALAMTIGRLFGDKLHGRFGDKNLMVACSIVAFFGLSLSILFNDPVGVIMGFFMVGLGLSIITPMAYSVACSSGNIPPATAVAQTATIGYTAYLFASPIIGFIADWQSLRVSLGFVGIFFGVMAVLSRAVRVKVVPQS